MSTSINTVNNVQKTIHNEINAECENEQLSIDANNMADIAKDNSSFAEIIDMCRENVINIICTKNSIVHLIEYTDQIEYYNELNKGRTGYKDIRKLLHWIVDAINETIDSAYIDIDYARNLYSSIYSMGLESKTTD